MENVNTAQNNTPAQVKKASIWPSFWIIFLPLEILILLPLIIGAVLRIPESGMYILIATPLTILHFTTSVCMAYVARLIVNSKIFPTQDKRRKVQKILTVVIMLVFYILFFIALSESEIFFGTIPKISDLFN